MIAKMHDLMTAAHRGFFEAMDRMPKPDALWRHIRERGAEATPLDRQITRLHRLGWAMVAVFLVGGGVWAATARLEGAAIALGTVGVESNRKSVSHLEGGIVREILVKDGKYGGVQ